ncbi:MAG TPA: hypothetical protein PKN96_03355 [Flavobacterium sp.]|uniref:hypothetical protein n=1 Tax=Flavobacterium sp. TaxID=239 RepID=UPI002B708035|nr:hypothetical protein [Flavobacterium sp.]HNP32309.1 hypothetical protein [Flavobacterium sp.]
MKKCFILFFVLTFTTTFSQTNYDTISLKSDADSRAANKYALEAANYLLNTPFDKNDVQRLKSLQFVSKWMEATPDFTFIFDATVNEKVVKGNEDLLGYYMAGMTKFCLENEDKSKNDALVMVSTIKILLAYCENPKNNLKMPPALQKLSDANKKGELVKALQ